MKFNRGRSRVASTYLQADQFQTAGYRIYYLFRNSSGYRTVGIHDGIPDDRRESLRYYFVHEFLNGGVKSRSLNLSSSFSSSSFRSLIPRVGCSIYRERFIQRKSNILRREKIQASLPYRPRGWWRPLPVSWDLGRARCTPAPLRCTS